MSKTTENVLTRNYSGKFGNQMVYRNRAGVSIMAKVPKKSKKPSTESQIAARRKFRMASRWAKEKLQDPAIMAEYKAMATGMKTAYVMAVTNYLSPPVIMEIVTSVYSGITGDKIMVVATDDFRVTGVKVTLADAAGTQVDQGSCTEDLVNDCWVFTATADLPAVAGVTVTAEATDYPGHTGSMTITL